MSVGGALRWGGQWFGAGALGPAGRTVALASGVLPLLVLRAWRPAWQCVAASLALGSLALYAGRGARTDDAVPAGSTVAALGLALSATRPTAGGLTAALLTVGALVHVRPAPMPWLEARVGGAAVELGAGALVAGALLAAQRALPWAGL